MVFTYLRLGGGFSLDDRCYFINPFSPTGKQCQFLIVGGKLLVMLLEIE